MEKWVGYYLFLWFDMNQIGDPYENPLNDWKTENSSIKNRVPESYSFKIIENLREHQLLNLLLMH